MDKEDQILTYEEKFLTVSQLVLEAAKVEQKYEKQQENVASRVIFREASQETKNKCYFSETTRMRQVIPLES